MKLITKHSLHAEARVAAILVIAAAAAWAQQGDPLSIATPVPMAAGAPAGSYILSPHETINLANGNLSFSVPLHQIGGRGKAGYMMSLPIGMKFNIVNNPNAGHDVYSVRNAYLPEASSWASGSLVRYTPGRIVRRNATDPSQGTFHCVLAGSLGVTKTFYQGDTLTKIVWIEADGTEHEFRDAASGGTPTHTGTGLYGCATDPNSGGPSRGHVFESDDSQSMSFFADSVLQDDITTDNFLLHNAKGVAGWVLFADGTRYQTNGDGFVTQIQDGNGNTTTFSYATDYSTFTVTDPLDRTTTVTFGAGADTIQFPPSRTITVNWDEMANHLRSGFSITSLNTLFETINASQQSLDPTIVSSVVLQDSSQYTFQYNNYGELARVVLPEGGAYEYDYPTSTPLCTTTAGPACVYQINSSAGGDQQGLYRRVTARRVYPDGSTLEGKTSYSVDSSGGVVTVSQMDASSTVIAKQVHSFSGNPLTDASYAVPPDAWYTNPFDGREVETDWEDSAGTVLKKVQNLWDVTNTTTNDVNLCETWTTLGSVVSGTISGFDVYSNQTDFYEYDYGVAPAVTDTASCPTASSGYTRHTHRLFQTGGYDTISTTVDASNHMRDLPQEIDVYGVSGGTEVQAAKTTAGYDETSLTAETGAFGYNAPGHSYRGNLTTISKYTDATHTLATTAHYDTLGNVVNTVDANSNQTSYDYTDACGANAPGVSIFAFPQTITNALSQVTTYSYDCATGNGLTAIDPNIANYNSANSASANTIASTYDDPFERVKNTVRSKGVADDETHTAYTYTTTSVSATSSLLTATDNTIQHEDDIDGLGRPKQHKDFFGAGAITVTKAYDALGRLYQASNPYQSDTETPAYTTTSYDALGRVTQVATADGAAVNTAYTDNSARVSDAAGKSRKSVYDALGRLMSVIEDPDGTPITTSYSYDVLDDLVSVTQTGLSTGCGSTRFFQYDWARRLTSACNPESGTISWTYDGVGNPLTRTDARSVVTTYDYDALNRIRHKTYTGTPNAPTVTYDYDDSAVSNSIGRLTQVSSTASTSRTTAYDTLGRVKATSQITNGSTYGFTGYAYNRAGGLTSVTYPSGRTIAMANYDVLGRPGSVSSGSTNYASSVQYASHGAIKSMALGNGLTETTSWNMQRLQPSSIALSGSVWSSSLYYCASHAANCTSNNGNIIEQDFTSQGVSFAQTYSYDSLNRLAGATETSSGSTTWSQTFGYDNFGNRAITAHSGNGTFNPVWTADLLTQFTGKNRFVRDTGGSGADTYDAAGNQLSVASSKDQPDVVANTMTYDAESRMVSSNTANTGTVNYSYDGDGRRVMKSIPGDTTTVYVYDGLGQLAAEYAGAVPIAGTVYLTGDHLGSTRVMTSAANTGVNGPSPGPPGTVIKCYDYMPFGEDVPAGVGSRGACYGNGVYPSTPDYVSEKFTAKERDAESGLDYFGARYYGSALGRFTNPDPKLHSAAFLTNPQKWNKYAYVLNNPLSLIDPDGQEEVTIQYRAFIPQATLGYGQVSGRGDNRSFSTQPNASSRVSVTMRVETDPTKNNGNPLVGKPVVGISSSHNNLTGNDTAAVVVQAPTVSATQDSNGNVNLSLQLNVHSGDIPIPGQGIVSNVNIGVNGAGTQGSVNGIISGSPAFEANFTPQGAPTTNLPLQDAPKNTIDFLGGLFKTGPVHKKTNIKQAQQ